MTDAVRSELTKLLARRMLLVAAVLIALSAFAAGFLPPALSANVMFNRELVAGSWGVASFGFFLVLVFSCSASGYEFKARALATLAVRGRSRAQLMAAKLIVLAVIAVCAALLTGLMLAVGWVLGDLVGGFQPNADLDVSEATAPWAEAFVRAALVFASGAILGAMLGTVLRSTAAAIIAGLGAMLFLEGAVSAVIVMTGGGENGWTPLFFQTLTLIAFGGEQSGSAGDGAGGPTPMGAYVTLACWLAAFVAIALAVFRARDIA